ncbi:MAG: hypothetical protein M3458_24780 [Acidobacteriota bacterium]|nr:hypothetical protein [Acidobacteriota bacterium]
MSISLPRFFRSHLLSFSGAVLLFPLAALLVTFAAPVSTEAQQTVAPITTSATAGAPTPSDVVREFYRAWREKRFRDAFMMSIHRPAIESLSAEEYEDLRPDFERNAALMPFKVEISGEQISGDTATVFVRYVEHAGDSPSDTVPVMLLGAGGTWIVGDRAEQEEVKKAGREFFFNARIEQHQRDVEAVLVRIANAQALYSVQHGGLCTDLRTLVAATPSLKDIETSDSTGYHFRINVSKNAKVCTAGAEPARYGRTGRLSFFMDQTGITKKDNEGKPLKGSTARK